MNIMNSPFWCVCFFSFATAMFLVIRCFLCWNKDELRPDGSTIDDGHLVSGSQVGQNGFSWSWCAQFFHILKPCRSKIYPRYIQDIAHDCVILCNCVCKFHSICYICSSSHVIFSVTVLAARERLEVLDQENLCPNGCFYMAIACSNKAWQWTRTHSLHMFLQVLAIFEGKTPLFPVDFPSNPLNLGLSVGVPYLDRRHKTFGTRASRATYRVFHPYWTCPIPIGSMYGIYGNIYHQYTPNVSIYTIHGSYGIAMLVYWRVFGPDFLHDTYEMSFSYSAEVDFGDLTSKNGKRWQSWGLWWGSTML